MWLWWHAAQRHTNNMHLFPLLSSPSLLFPLLSSFQDMCNAAVKFVAHLVNQQVLHELVALELLTLLLEDPTDDSVEVSIGFLKVGGRRGRRVFSDPISFSASYARTHTQTHTHAGVWAEADRGISPRGACSV